MHIISTTPEGTVNVTTPASKFMAAVTRGGMGHLPDSFVIAKQIENSIASGFDPDFSSRFVTALVIGGETDAGGRDLIRIRHLHKDTNHRVQVLPTLDRWFRDAWRQNAETGGLYVDMTAARLVFAKRLIAAKGQKAKFLTSRAEIAILTRKPDDAVEAAHQALKGVDLHALADLMARAESPEALRAIWPGQALGDMADTRMSIKA